MIGDMNSKSLEYNKSDELRWLAVKNRDASAAGKFVYAVKTTGIYCLPGCRSRLPKRENVVFFTDAASAGKNGYRSCKRCRPDEPDYHQYVNPETEMVIRACRAADASENMLKVTELAAEAGISPGHFQRVFKKITGITPKEYVSKVHSRRFLEALENGSSVTEAVYLAGYSGPSRAHEQMKSDMGMSPSLYRRGAPGVSIRYSLAECYLGWVIVGATVRGICAVMFDDTPDALPDMLKERFPQAQITAAEASESEILRDAVAAIKTPGGISGLPLDIIGTAFQKLVWKALMKIPAGCTVSYAEIAERIGRPDAVRAVAGACGANNIAQLVPCHRVIRRDGGLGGYRWGLHRKKMILDRENRSGPEHADEE